MTDRPLLMSGPMVLGTLKGWKTQTRRVLTGAPMEPIWFCDPDTEHGHVFVPKEGLPRIPACVHYEIGDRLYIREAWRTHYLADYRPPRDLPQTEHVQFEADESLSKIWLHGAPFHPGKFRQGMHMPRWASRLTLVVTDVRVQRIQDISPEDAIAEGIEREETHFHGTVFSHGNDKTGCLVESRDPCKVFATLWDDLNKDRGFGWEANPWVVAVSFEAHHCNIDQLGAML